jgi:hypothetical protein
MISCGLKELVEEYKKEKNQDCWELKCHEYAASTDFLEWMADRVISVNNIQKEEMFNDGRTQ